MPDIAMCSQHEELVKLAAELRDILFADATDMMQGAMAGCPVECVAFAKWWIQREKGTHFDDHLDVCVFRISSELPHKRSDLLQRSSTLLSKAHGETCRVTQNRRNGDAGTSA